MYTQLTGECGENLVLSALYIYISVALPKGGSTAS